MPLDPLRVVCVWPAPKSRSAASDLSRKKSRSKSRGRAIRLTVPCRSALARDLPGTGSETYTGGVSDSSSRLILLPLRGRSRASALLRPPGRSSDIREFATVGKPDCYGFGERTRFCSAFMRDSPNAAKRDLGAGQTQAARSGLSGMDAARAPSGQGCPFGAGPRSVVGVREPDAGGPNQEQNGLVTLTRQSDPL